MKKLEQILKSIKKKLLNANGYLIVKQEPIKIIRDKYTKLTKGECENLLKQAYRSQKKRYTTFKE